MDDSVSKIQDLIEDDFVSSGITDTYSYPAVIKTINFFQKNIEVFKFKAIDLSETRGAAVFSWIEDNKLCQYCFIYIKDWKENNNN